MLNFCLLLIIGIVFITLFLKKTKYDMEDYYNLTTEELIMLKNEKYNEYDFATYTERINIMREIEGINKELENRNL